MLSRHYYAFCLGLLGSFTRIAEVAGQITTPFTWGPGLSQTALKECEPVALHTTAIPGGSLYPPFYLIAYEPSGPATISNIGSDHVNLSWTVNYPAGSQVIIQIVDSKGASAGTGPHVYPINPGTSSSCHSTSTSPIKLSVNASRLDTCDYLKLDIVGGTKPYTVTFAGVNSNGGLNATLGANDDEYVWVNRFAPGQEMIAVVSDANGVYSNTSPLIPTSGTIDVTCGSEQSHSEAQAAILSPSVTSTSASQTSTSHSIPTPTPPTAHPSTTAVTPVHTSGDTSTNSSKNHTSTGPIIGGVVGVIGAAVIVATLVYCFVKRRRERLDDDGVPYSSHLKPEPFTLAERSFGNEGQRQQPPFPQQGQMSEFNVAPTLYGYGWRKGPESEVDLNYHPNSSQNLSAKYPTPTPSSAGSETCYYDMSSPTGSIVKLAPDSTTFSPVQKSPPPALSNAFYPPGVKVPNHAPALRTKRSDFQKTSSVFISRRRAPTPQLANPRAQPQNPGPPKGMMLVDRVPNVMRSLQPQSSQPGRASSPLRQQQQVQPTPQPSHPYPTQRAATPSNTEPASVSYARSRNSLFSNSAMSSGSAGSQTTAQIVHTSQYPQPLSRTTPETRTIAQSLAARSEGTVAPSTTAGTFLPSSRTRARGTDEPRDQEAEGDGEADTLLAYNRNSVASSAESEASAYPPTLRNGPPVPPPKSSPPPPMPNLQYHQHEDGGPVLDVPPAYRDRYSKHQPHHRPKYA